MMLNFEEFNKLNEARTKECFIVNGNIYAYTDHSDSNLNQVLKVWSWENMNWSDAPHSQQQGKFKNSKSAKITDNPSEVLTKENLEILLSLVKADPIAKITGPGNDGPTVTESRFRPLEYSADVTVEINGIENWYLITPSSIKKKTPDNKSSDSKETNFLLRKMLDGNKFSTTKAINEMQMITSLLTILADLKSIFTGSEEMVRLAIDLKDSDKFKNSQKVKEFLIKKRAQTTSHKLKL